MLLTVPVPTAAKLLGMSPSTLYRAAKTGDTTLNITKVGSRAVISAESLANALGVTLTDLVALIADLGPGDTPQAA